MKNIFEKILTDVTQGKGDLNGTIKDLFGDVLNGFITENKPTIPTEIRMFDVLKALRKKDEETIPEGGMERLFEHDKNVKYLSSLINEWDYSSEYLKDQNSTIKNSIHTKLSR